jgi:beta-lactamase class A
MRTFQRPNSARRGLVSNKPLIELIACFFLIIVFIQIIYPNDKALPFAKLNHESIAFQNYSELASKIEKYFQVAKVKLIAGSNSYSVTLAAAGANPNTDKMIANVVKYPLWQRLIPFSIVVKQPDISALDVYFNQIQLQKVGEEAAKKLSTDSADAKLAIEKGILVASEARPGYKLSQGEIMTAMTNAIFTTGQSTVRLTPTKIEPKRSDTDIAPVRHQAELAIAKKITIDGPNNEVYIPSEQDIASWLVVKTLENNSVELGFDTDQLSAYAASLNDKLKVDPGVTKVSIADGEETNRQQGSAGIEVDTDALTNDLRNAVMGTSVVNKLAIRMQPVPSVVVNDRQYSSSQKGLQAYVDYATSAQDVHIALTQLDGEKWTANGRENDSIPSASTYKLYVALVMFDRLDKGELHWDDPMLDTTVAGCFERMIVPSTNPCAEKFIADFGRNYINDFIYARGFSHGTTFTAPDATHTTAADLEKYVVGLQNGTLVSGNNRDILLDKMGRQLYPYGVPTGSKGKVQDKVGFLWDYVHDTAIVHHPKGTYVVTIMTRGQSYARIAQITRDLERIMYP